MLDQLRSVLAQARTAAAPSTSAPASGAPPPLAAGPSNSWAHWAWKLAEKGARYAGVPIPDEDLPRTVEEREELYAMALSLAKSDTYHDFEACGCVETQGLDRKGNRLVLVLGKKMPPFANLDRDRFKRWVYTLLDDVVNDPYTVVYLHTEVTDDNSPGSSWVYNFFEALPPKYQDNLQAFHVVHPALTLRAAVAITPFVMFTPFISGSFHHKVVYIDRLEFLWEHIEKKDIHLPGYVDAHDNELEEHPLMDYGVMRTPETELGPSIGGGGLAEPLGDSSNRGGDD